MTEARQQKLKQVCEIIYGYSHCSGFESFWEHTNNPHTIKMGGPSSLVEQGNKIMDLIDEAFDAGEQKCLDNL